MRTFVDFVEKYRPGFSKEIVPADSHDIAVLEKYAGPLPGTYRRFLETMGKSMGDLELAEASFSIEGALGAYSWSWLRGGRYIYFAGDKEPSGNNFSRRLPSCELAYPFASPSQGQSWLPSCGGFHKSLQNG